MMQEPSGIRHPGAPVIRWRERTARRWGGGERGPLGLQTAPQLKHQRCRAS
jgi:hypothetical protein